MAILAGDSCCQAARQLGGLRFLCSRAPRLPLPECQANHCDCRYRHYSDRRSGLDRRATYDWARERGFEAVNRRAGFGRRSTDAVALG